MLTFGGNDLGALADTRYLAPGYVPTPGTGRLGVITDVERTLLEMVVKHNTPIALLNTPITYTVRVDGEDTGLSVQLAPSAASASVEAEVNVPAYSLIEVVATKSGILSSGLVAATVTLKDIT